MYISNWITQSSSNRFLIKTKWYYCLWLISFAAVHTESHRFNLSSRRCTANESCVEICRNKWLFRSMKYPSFFPSFSLSLSCSGLADGRDINFYYHFAVPHCRATRLFAVRKFWRAGIQRAAWSACEGRISGMCEWSPCAGGIYWKWLSWFSRCHEDYPIHFRGPSNFFQTIRQIKSNLVDVRGHDRVRHE